MRVKVNKPLLLWSLAVIQPASASDIRCFLAAMYPDIREFPKAGDIHKVLDDWRENDEIRRVHGRSRLYSLTSKGNTRLDIRLRHHRDKLRFVLLKQARAARFEQSGDAPQGLFGGSPNEDISSGTQEVAQQINSAAIPRVAQNGSRIYWPRLLQQLDFPVGFDVRSPDTFFEYYSFPSVALIHLSSEHPGDERDLSPTDLALAIGVSPRLLASFMHNSEEHYRQFEIGKRGGGKRTINAPRLFLKTTQSWLTDYLLGGLPVHNACHSYQRGRSILTNAINHVGQNYVGNVDIENFFGSVNARQVKRLLADNGFGSYLASTISKLATLDDKLPQGAPSSPHLSNAILYSFDSRINEMCSELSLNYTRYADDITISGESRDAIANVIGVIGNELGTYRLRLNQGKTRLAGRGGQQRVAGVVVNEKAQPPRKLRREIRAMFHQAQLRPDEYRELLPQLKGYLNYLKSYPVLAGSRDIEKYRRIVRELSANG